MKRLLEQNGMKIFTNLFLSFNCNHCGCKFMSDEYSTEVENLLDNKKVYRYIDKCFTCEELCIIEEEVNGED